MTSDLKRANAKSVEAYSEFADILKHAARYLLWLPEVRALREDRKRFLKYFTLPGKWAWDIFFFERNSILERNERGFPNVRFCDNNGQSYVTAKRLLGNTVGKKGNFEDLVLGDRQEFWGGFPYDVYNLDFCGTCLPREQPPFSNTFAAVTKIVEKHVSLNHFPFIILLTMKALAGETSDEAQSELKDNIETNRREPELAEQINAVIPNTELFVQTNFPEFIMISIPKVICHLASAHCKVEVKCRAKYPRRDATYFITKFVFRFVRSRRTSLRITNPVYVASVRDLLQLNNVILIDESRISAEIRESHRALQEYVNSLTQRH